MKNKSTIFNKEVRQRITSKGVFPFQWAFTLLFPVRNIFLSPKQLINRLELLEDSTILEIGPGPGYFSIPIAKELKRGKLYLADIQQEMIDYARRRLSKQKLFNTEYYLCDGKTFAFKSNYFDIIFMVTVIGEIENKDDYLKEFYRMLKPNGILSISELAGDPDKISTEELKILLGKHSFKFHKVYGNKRNFTLNFKKSLDAINK